MICQYSVKNYKSIKDEVTLNMEALDISEYTDTLISFNNNERYLPLSAIYGPNGGGKSNILSSLSFLASKITAPVIELFKDDNSSLQNRSNNSFAVPFKFDDKSQSEPSEFDLYFIDGKYEYHYYASILGKEFVEEYLSRRNIELTRYTNLFLRNNNKIQLFGSLAKYNSKDISKDISLISYLRIMHNENAIVKSVYSWFKYGLISIDSTKNSDRHFNELALIAVDKIDNYHEMIVNMMKEMDIDIDDYEIIEENGFKNVYTKHAINKKEKRLKFDEESMGTKKIAGLLSYIMLGLSMGSTLIVDELDSNIHPKLLGYIMNLFSNKKINKNGSQLIFTSHDLVTMSSDYLRRDEIWFIAKNSEESSFLYSLAEFKKKNGKSPRKDETYSKQYLEGRYGSDPYLQKIIVW